MTVDRTRVVVTGMGVMAPIGQNVEEYWNNLVSGVSGIGKITLCDASEFPNDIAGEKNRKLPIIKKTRNTIITLTFIIIIKFLGPQQ